MTNNPNFSNRNQSSLPLYPEEVYSEQNNIAQQNAWKEPPAGENKNLFDSPLMPLLLSALQGGDNSDMMKNLLSMMGGSGKEASLIQALSSSFGKNKKKENAKTQTFSGEKAFPKNEFIN